MVAAPKEQQPADSSPLPPPSPPPLPPGTVLGPDGKPCKICSSGFNAWTATQKKQKKNIRKPLPSTFGDDDDDGKLANNITSTNTSTIFTTTERDCPPDSDRLGRHTWTFLHTTAAYYPDQPSPPQKSSMLNLLKSLPTLYPCRNCADELGTYMKTHPPEQAIGNRTLLGQWMCQVHNEVNERLGKDSFDCSTVDQRWKEGWSDGRCD